MPQELGPNQRKWVEALRSDNWTIRRNALVNRHDLNLDDEKFETAYSFGEFEHAEIADLIEADPANWFTEAK